MNSNHIEKAKIFDPNLAVSGYRLNCPVVYTMLFGEIIGNFGV